MMRSWESRPDTIVCDEPLYARYLLATGVDHPCREETIARHESDLESIIQWLTGPLPPGKSIFYQKHMSHHLLPGDDLGWTESLTNVFFIRDPAEMITSYIRVVPEPRPEDLGLPQQIALFDRERRRTGRTPPVIDARDVLTNPRGMLNVLCERLGLPFFESMLRWAPGPRETDGAWAPAWYQAVWESRGFEPYQPRNRPVPGGLVEVEKTCRSMYDMLWACRLTC